MKQNKTEQKNQWCQAHLLLIWTVAGNYVLILGRIFCNHIKGLVNVKAPSPLPVCSLALVEMVTLFSCMCMIPSDTLTAMESAASSMLKGPPSLSATTTSASDVGRAAGGG